VPARSGLSGLLRWCLPFNFSHHRRLLHVEFTDQFSLACFPLLACFLHHSSGPRAQDLQPAPTNFSCRFFIMASVVAVLSAGTVFPLGIHRFSSILPIAALIVTSRHRPVFFWSETCIARRLSLRSNSSVQLAGPGARSIFPQASVSSVPLEIFVQYCARLVLPRCFTSAQPCDCLPRCVRCGCNLAGFLAWIVARACFGIDLVSSVQRTRGFVVQIIFSW
jgi:hypothetical protein